MVSQVKCAYFPKVYNVVQAKSLLAHMFLLACLSFAWWRECTLHIYIYIYMYVYIYIYIVISHVLEVASGMLR